MFGYLDEAVSLVFDILQERFEAASFSQVLNSVACMLLETLSTKQVIVVYVNPQDWLYKRRLKLQKTGP